MKEIWQHIRRNGVQSMVIFKKTFDHMNGTCSNEKYWHMAPQDKVSLNIARHFNMEGYELIESFIGA
jgi:hypothetical protein